MELEGLAEALESNERQGNEFLALGRIFTDFVGNWTQKNTLSPWLAVQVEWLSNLVEMDGSTVQQFPEQQTTLSNQASWLKNGQFLAI